MASSVSPQASATAQAALQSSVAAAGAPYSPINHASGSPPTPIPDIPVSAVFLFIFLICAVVNFYLLKTNLKRGHKFIFSGAMFGFSNIRVISAALRIAWARHPHNVRLGIAAGIFIYAGAFILYVINIFFTQRIVRAQHPHIGWSKPFDALIILVVVLAIGSLVMVIVATVQQFYTLDASIRLIDHKITVFVSTTFVVLAFLPIPMLLISTVLPRRIDTIDSFGTGRFSTKYVLLMCTAILLTLGITFRDGIQFLRPVSILAPTPWYFDKGCFYGFGFTTDALVLIIYLLFRVDLRFYIPNGAKGPGSYSSGAGVSDSPDDSSPAVSIIQDKDVESLTPATRAIGDHDAKAPSTPPLSVDERTGSGKSHQNHGSDDNAWSNPAWNPEEMLDSMFGKHKK